MRLPSPTALRTAVLALSFFCCVQGRVGAADIPPATSAEASRLPAADEATSLALPSQGADAPKPAPAAPAAEAKAAVKSAGASMAEAEARGLLALGDRLTERADYSAAEIAYRQILNSREFPAPFVRDALLGLAHMHRLQGAHTKAAAIYEKFLKEYPEDRRVPDALLDLGRTLRSLGAHRMAITRFYSVLNSTLKVPAENFDHYQLLAKTAQFEIAETYFESGDYAEAGKFFSRLRLLELAPADQARAHFKSACALQLAGDLEGAVHTLRDYLETWPKDENVPEARYVLATTLRRLNRPDDALTATLELLRSEQARSGADARRWSYWQRRTGNQLANDFFQSGDTINALAIYQGLAALSPEAAWRLPVTYQIALCYERLRLVDRARGAYQSIVDGVAELGTGKNAQSVPVELTELSRMAGWRMSNLDWVDRTEHQLTVFFSTNTGRRNLPGPNLPAPPPSQ